MKTLSFYYVPRWQWFKTVWLRRFRFRIHTRIAKLLLGPVLDEIHDDLDSLRSDLDDIERNMPDESDIKVDLESLRNDIDSVQEAVNKIEDTVDDHAGRLREVERAVEDD